MTWVREALREGGRVLRRRWVAVRELTDSSHDGWEPIRPRESGVHGFILPWKTKADGAVTLTRTDRGKGRSAV